MTDSSVAGRRILVVEDEMLVAMGLEDMLSELGCEVVAMAARPAQALAAIETKPIDAAVLDLNLDGTMSYGVADALIARGVPFIFSTGYSEAKLQAEYRDRPLLKKPFHKSDLERALAQALADRID